MEQFGVVINRVGLQHNITNFGRHLVCFRWIFSLSWCAITDSSPSPSISSALSGLSFPWWRSTICGRRNIYWNILILTCFTIYSSPCLPGPTWPCSAWSLRATSSSRTCSRGSSGSSSPSWWSSSMTSWRTCLALPWDALHSYKYKIQQLNSEIQLFLFS